MPKQKRYKTGCKGVCYIEAEGGKIFYIVYRKDAKLIEEPAGHSKKDQMTVTKANNERALRISDKYNLNTKTKALGSDDRPDMRD